MNSAIIELPNLAATQALACKLAGAIDVPQTIVLNGTLGVGKTQWIRFFSESLGASRGDVTSPTYVLHQLYRGRESIHHFDFYRLESIDEVWDLGIDELFEQPAIVLIEWADKFPDCLPDDHLEIQLTQHEQARRRAKLIATGPKSTGLLNRSRIAE